ncbi:LLM class flavin-dependent oxidoreductase [Nakamurella antarctica]|uniref:LLM class flavin-dependent oxidoreductase n=1 Tax=Nakamurella antarctica TaxID=1902245 RepID=A0A3G8ZKB1_9ACTN|nr:LLM class flavin-dependent oxidoreductase [Nakamurella antarctica]AZI57759.1 LLM class flavin-dependent oxidoreductase [Nakamurella antarctica]
MTTSEAGIRAGVVILPQFGHRETATRWKAVQEMGFAHGWTYDHLAWRSLADEPWHATIPTLAVAALATTTMKIGTWVTSPNYRHPVTLAKDLMTLDDISDGRMIAGIGAGGEGWDSAVLGQDDITPRERADRLVEFVTLLDLLLRQSETSFSGNYFDAVRARMIPGCIQQPRLPLVIAANGKRTMRLAASFGAWATTGAPLQKWEDRETLTMDQWWAGVARLVDGYNAAEPPEASLRYLSLDGAPVFSLASIDAFTDACGRAAALGFTDVVTHWPRPEGEYAGDPAVLEHAASLLGDGGIVGF